MEHADRLACSVASAPLGLTVSVQYKEKHFFPYRWDIRSNPNAILGMPSTCLPLPQNAALSGLTSCLDLASVVSACLPAGVAFSQGDVNMLYGMFVIPLGRCKGLAHSWGAVKLVP